MKSAIWSGTAEALWEQPPGQARRYWWPAARTDEGTTVNVPLVVLSGRAGGPCAALEPHVVRSPRVALVAGVHGDEVEARGVGVVSHKGQYTESHCLLLKVAPFGAGQQVAARLEVANVIVNAAHLPQELGREGIRIGVQEITRMGAVEDDMEALAGLIADVVMEKGALAGCQSRARQFAARFQRVHFTWE